MPSLIVTRCAIFESYHWETCSFLKGKGEVNLGKRAGEGGLRRVEGGKKCGQGSLNERRINEKETSICL